MLLHFASTETRAPSVARMVRSSRAQSRGVESQVSAAKGGGRFAKLPSTRTNYVDAVLPDCALPRRPDMALIANPQIDKYFDEWYDALIWLVRESVPT